MAVRRGFLLALSLLAGCTSEGDQPSGRTSTNELATQLDVQPTAASAAELDQRARSALLGAVQDPAGIRLANLRAGTSGSICGEVDAKTGTGRSPGFRPFLVTPEGVALISGTQDVRVNDPSDTFADFYIRYCATPEEAPLLERMMIEPGNGALPAPTNDIPDPLEPAASAPPSATSPSAPPPGSDPARNDPQVQPAGEESFLKAVIRPGKDVEK